MQPTSRPAKVQILGDSEEVSQVPKFQIKPLPPRNDNTELLRR